MSVRPSVRVSVRPRVRPSMHTCTRRIFRTLGNIFQNVCYGHDDLTQCRYIFVRPPVRPSIRPSFHPSVHPSIRPSVRPRRMSYRPWGWCQNTSAAWSKSSTWHYSHPCAPPTALISTLIREITQLSSSFCVPPTA